MITDFDIKFKKLPTSVQNILLSDFQRILSFELGDQYKLEGNQLSICNEIVTQVYLGVHPLNSLVDSLRRKINLDEKTAKELACDLLGKKILAARDYFVSLGQDPQAIMKNYGGNENAYTEDIALLKKAVEEEKEGTYNHDDYLYRHDVSMVKKEISKEITGEDLEDEIGTLTTEEQASALKNFFENNLLLALTPDAAETLSEINDSLLLVFSENKLVQQEIERLLTNNKALIGSKLLIDENKAIPQTVANWLKDFYKVVGTKGFDSLSVTHYFIQSPNAKILSENDQQLLRRFLTLYNNIKNFPNIFNELPLDQWHIIPHVSEVGTPKVRGNSLSKSWDYSEQAQGSEPIQARPRITPLRKPITSLSHSQIPTSISKKVSQEKVESKPKAIRSEVSSISPELLNLRNMLLEYPPNSLERQAIEEEIKKLEKQQ